MRTLNPGTWTLRHSLGRSRHGGASWAGFTLLEVLVTLFIITLLVGLVVPRMGQSNRDAMRVAGMRFRNVLQWVQDRATYTGVAYRLHLDLVGQRYWCEWRNGEVFAPVSDPLLRMVPLDPAHGRMMWVPYGDDLPDLDEVVVSFSSYGPDRPIMVRFVGMEGEGYSVSLRPEWWMPRLSKGLLVWDDMGDPLDG